MSGVEEFGRKFEVAEPQSEVPPARAKLFTHGGSQAVRLPKAFRFEGKEVVVRKDGRRVILEPADPAEDDLEAFFARIDANRRGTPEEDWPDPEPLYFDDDQDLTW